MPWFALGRVGRTGLVLLLAACASTGSKDVPAARPEEAPAKPLISYCDLVASPARFLGRQVRVVGVYRVGFEWQELYSTRCPDAHTTTVEWIGHDTCPDLPASVKNIVPDANLHEASKLDYGRTFGLIARGTLLGGDGVGYGHMNAYTFHFDVGCVEYRELLDVPSYTVHALTRGMRRRVERFLAKTDRLRRNPGPLNER